MNSILYKSRHALVNELKAIAGEAGEEYKVLQWNRFVPDSSVWWLSPSNRSPAFSETKFVVMSQDNDPCVTHVGIHAEKGAGDVAKEFVSKEWVMDESWQWHSFMRHVQEGRLQAALQKCAERLGAPMQIMLHSYPVLTRSRETELRDSEEVPPAPSVEIARYSLNAGDAELVRAEEIMRISGSTYSYPMSLDQNEFAALLEQFSRDAWTWLDVFVTTAFTSQPDLETKPVIWSPGGMWRDYLRHLHFAVGPNRA